MKTKTLLLLFISTLGFAQNKLTNLNFDTKYFDAVDKWVAFPKNPTDSTHIYGFIYLDNNAGFTFHYENKFKIENEKLNLITKDSASTNIKYRLQPNVNLVSILNKEQISALHLPKQPKWLSVYKQKSDDVEYLKNEGYHYNHAGASKLALQPLLKAYKIQPHFKGLEFELSYAYNALKEFKKAIPILERAIENNPKDFYFYRELGFSYVNLSRIESAEKTYLKGIEISDNDFEKSEMAVNMAKAYFKLRDKEKFDEWANLTRKYAKKDSNYLKYIEAFEKNWNKD